MKIVVTGASGLLGREIYRVLKEQRHQVLGLGFDRAGQGLTKVNLTDTSEIVNFLVAERPDLVIHAAAERRPEVCKYNPKAAEALNVHSTGWLAELSNQFKFKLIFISSDYVFNGTSAPYDVCATTNPINQYGRNKVAAEQIVLDHKGIVIRVPILYGPTQKLPESAITTIAQDLLDGKFKHDDWAVRYPTLTTDVALVIGDLLGRHYSKLKGIYHWSGEESFTKFEMAKIIAGVLGIDESEVKAKQPGENSIPRPQDCHLDKTRIHNLAIEHQSRFKQVIREVIETALVEEEPEEEEIPQSTY